MNVHFTAGYLLNPTHPVTIDVAGCGGTGSMVISGLARLNEALRSLGHPGLFVRVFDNDTVSEANIGRQLFSSSDIGQNKAGIILTRINRFFSLNWQSYPCLYGEELEKENYANIIISCVDTIKSRLEIDTYFKMQYQPDNSTVQSKIPYYWLDYGNSRDTGQVILGTLQKIKQPKSENETFGRLKTVIDVFPDISEAGEDNEPSCSLAEALNKQDLFINSTLAQYGLGLIWKLFREAFIRFHGAFVNLDNFQTNPIMIK
jgi:PRTRC genetic system ThiF family protein